MPLIKLKHKRCKANYTQCLWSWLPVSPSNACGWLATQRNAHIKKTEGIMCILYCVHTQAFSGICLLCLSPFIFNENQVRRRLPPTGNIKALSYIWFRFCSADGRTRKGSLHPAIQVKEHLNPYFSNCIHLCNSRNQEE